MKKVIANNNENVDNNVLIDEGEPPIDSKTRKVNAKNKKQDEYEKKRDKIVSVFDLNEEVEQAGKLGKQLASIRKIKGGKKANCNQQRRKNVSWKTVI